MNSTHTPPQTRTSFALADASLFKAIGHLVGVAVDQRAIGDVLRLSEAMCVMLPRERETLKIAQAQALLVAGLPCDALDLMTGIAQPLADATRALCEMSMGNERCFELARQVAASGDEAATNLVSPLLQHLPESEHQTAAPADEGGES